MNYSSLAAAFVLLISPHLAAAPIGGVFNAQIRGTIARQVITGPGTGRIQVARLDMERIFEEFALSREDYALVFDFQGSGELLFRAKSAAAGLPDVRIFGFTGKGATLFTTKTQELRLDRSLSSDSIATVFEALAGTAAAVVTGFKEGAAEGISLQFTGHGTDESPNAPSPVLLKFKVVTTMLFKQKP